MKKKKNGIKVFFKKMKDSIAKIPKKAKIIICVWVVLLIVLLVIVAASNSNKKRLEDYKKMEQNLTNATLTYMNSKELYPTPSKKLIVDLTMLKELGYASEDAVSDKTCKGYSLVYYIEDKEEYSIESFLNCKGYTTKDYSVNLD